MSKSSQNPLLSASELSGELLSEQKAAALEHFLRLLTKDVGFQDFMGQVLGVVAVTVPCEAGSIFEMDQEAGQLFFRAASGQGAGKVTHFKVPKGQGVVGHVAESREALVVNRIDESNLHLKSISDAVGFKVRNLVAIPIVIRGEVFGVLELLNRAGTEQFSPEDLDLAGYLTSMAAKAIEVRLVLGWGASEAAKAAEAKRAG